MKNKTWETMGLVETPQDYARVLEGHLPMPIQRWRAIKGLLYVLIMAGVAFAGIIEGRWAVPIVFIIGAMLIFGIEINEIMIADRLRITFKDLSDDDDGEE